MANHPVQSRMVAATSLRDWLLWLAEHYDPQQDSPENAEMRRLGRTLEELGRLARAIDTNVTVRTAAYVEKFGAGGTCLLSSFDWEGGEIEFAHPRLLENRLGSADPDALIARLIAVTGIPERLPPEPEYVV